MQQLHGTKIQISQEGIITAWDQYYVTDETGIDDIPQTRPAVTGGRAMKLVEISSEQAEEGRQHIVTAKYEGLAAEQFVNPVYAWEPEEAETDIVLNPNIKELWERYEGAWDNDLAKVLWPKTLSGGKGKSKSMENPMLGVDSFLDMYGQWTETTAAERIERDIFEDMWSVVESVPGNFPTPKGRLWFVLPPQVTQRGACWEIKRRWKLTGVMTDDRLEATRLIYRSL